MAGSVGGKSRLRGIDFELQGGLEEVETEVGEEVADGLLGVSNDVTGGGEVEGVGDGLAELVEARAEGSDEVLGGDGRKGVHADLRKGEGLKEETQRNGNRRFTLLDSGDGIREQA